MIVKDEAAIMPRCLSFAGRVCTTATICDTGSTDDTVKIVRGLMPPGGRLYRHKWRNYGYNLTLAQRRAKGSAAWLLRLDADMLVGALPHFLDWLQTNEHEADAYMVTVEDHGDRYRLPLLMRGDLDWRYEGATHEALDITGRRVANVEGFKVVHEADGANRLDKFERDLGLLRDGFKAKESRAIFYTAQTHRAMGHDEQAALIYDLRANMNGWEEERWYAQYQAAKLRRDVPALIRCWRARPWRHEPLSAAARIVASDHPDGAGDWLFLEQPVK